MLAALLLVAAALSNSSLLTCSDAGSPDDEVKEHQQHLPGIPRLVQSPPVISYVKPGKSVRVKCVADPATFVNIFCNEKIVNRGKMIQKVENERPGGSRLTFYVDVSFRDIHQWFGKEDYWCLCEAWNHVPTLKKPKKIRSRKAFIKIACKCKPCPYL